MSLPSSDFTVATTSWMPDLSSSAFDFASMSLLACGDITPAWSTTRPVSCGKLKAKAREAKNKQSAAATESVIPGRANWREPGIHNHAPRGLVLGEPIWMDLGLWIPGTARCAVPE